MPTIISDKELKSLDNILKQEKECTWALEAEIDYTAKLDFSDNSSDEEGDEQKKSTTTAASTAATSKPTVIDATKKAPADSAGSEGTSGSKAPLLGPTPPFNQDRTSYVGRKSDSVYEFNRHDQEVSFPLKCDTACQ